MYNLASCIYGMPSVVFSGKLGSGWWDEDEAFLVYHG